MAQQMYKVVGPDGKVTFSDRPALQSSSNVSVMRSYTLRPLGEKRTPAEIAAEAASGKKSSTAPSGTTGALPAVPILTPEVEDAIVAVKGQVEFARHFYNFCNTSVTAAGAFNAAASGWKKRNATAVEQQHRLLTEVVSPSKRDELQHKVTMLLAEESAKVAARNPKDREAWCSGAIAELNSGKLDINQPAMMAVPIVTYRAK